MAVKKTAKIRRSPADIKKAWQKLEPELARQRAERECQGETFTSISRPEFEAKRKPVKSPMIVFQSWNDFAPPEWNDQLLGRSFEPRSDNVEQPGRFRLDRQSQSNRH